LNKIYNDVYIGDFTDNNGYRIPGEIKELLKVAFLKPLRDAENQMVAKKGSRLSQILLSIDHEILNDNEDNKLKNIISDANTKIKNATNEIKMKKIGDSKEVAIIDIINQFINKANPEREGIEANFQIKDDSLREILEKLSVEFNNPNEGLGIENLLYIAIEFLLLKNSSYSGLKTVLIEEIEAHLHPQTQINLINFIIKNYSQGESGQIIMSTHSPNITSKVDIEKIILCKNNSVYSLKSSDTRLEKGDYKFLARFLDVTKSNLFFSKKIIFVEGDAENILIPTIAKIILGDTLESKGISVINVGSTAFLRYSRIFQRKDEKDIDVKIAIITDLDVKKNENETEKMFNKREETERVRKTQYYTYKENIKVFISTKRTLEYCIAMSDLLRDDLVYSMFLAKKEMNSNANPDGKEKVKEALEEKNEFLKVNADSEDIASEIYDKNIIKSGNSISKAIIAQILANELEKKQEIDENFKIMLEADNSIKYIIDAIKFLGE
jgi:putative ATP-dependent endonuclease of OLD family